MNSRVPGQGGGGVGRGGYEKPVAAEALSLGRSLSAPVAGAPKAVALTRAQTVAPDIWTQRLVSGEQRFTDTLLHRIIEDEARSYVTSRSALERTGSWSGAQDWPSIMDDSMGEDALTTSKASEFKEAEPSRWKCQICLDDKDQTDEIPISGLCGNVDCKSLFCTECLRAYCEATVEDSRFMVRPVRCPSVGCGHRVPTTRWEKLVPSERLEQYVQGARNILTLRCEACDCTRSLLVEALPREQRLAKLRTIMPSAALETQSELQKIWAQFRDGAVSADAVLDILLTTFSMDIGSFMSFDDDRDGEFADRSPLNKILSLVTDVERRCVLHLAALRRNPLIFTHCCACPICWKCKVANHHDDKSCEEMQREDVGENVEIQFCPGCGVGTERTEGCSEMICLCGERWEWEGDEDY